MAGISIKRMLGSPVRPWPYGCFTQQTSSGRCACIPGRKYGNLFLFRGLCPDASRYYEKGSETFCTEKMQITQMFWCPPVLRLLAVGLFLATIWVALGYGIYQILPTTKKVKQAKVESFLSRGQTLAKEKKYDRALLAYRNAIKQDPKHAETRLYLGKCLLELNRVPAAFSEFKKAVEFNPTIWEAHLEIARLLMRANQTKEALHHATVAADTNTDLAEPELIAAYCLNQQGKREEAKTALDSGAKKNFLDDVKQLEFAASLYATLGHLDDADAYYRRAIERDSGSIDARTGLAHISIAQS